MATITSRIKVLKIITSGQATIKDMAFVIGSGMNETDGLIRHRILKLIDMAGVIHVSDMAFIVGNRAKLNGKSLDNQGYLNTSDDGFIRLSPAGVEGLNMYDSQRDAELTMAQPIT